MSALLVLGAVAGILLLAGLVWSRTQRARTRSIAARVWSHATLDVGLPVRAAVALSVVDGLAVARLGGAASELVPEAVPAADTGSVEECVALVGGLLAGLAGDADGWAAGAAGLWGGGGAGVGLSVGVLSLGGVAAEFSAAGVGVDE